MKTMRTISLKILPTPDQCEKLSMLQKAFAAACNHVVPNAVKHRCTNRVALHHLVYYSIRESFPSLGSQMTCNAVHVVSASYRTLIANNPKLKKVALPVINFKPTSSVHFDKRTYSFKSDILSLFTLTGREKIAVQLGEFQRQYITKGDIKEAELIHVKGVWYFNLVLEMPESVPTSGSGIAGIDIGENVLACISTGKMWGGGELRHKRDKYLAHRRRLQSNGSRSAKQLLRRISGREARHVKHTNHIVSKAIVTECLAKGIGEIRMEDLTHIRANIKASRRIRSRLHRWAFRQLQTFTEYKAKDVGIAVNYRNPAYTSQLCSKCQHLGIRKKHKFICNNCGNVQHSDYNSSLNLATFAEPIGSARGGVKRLNVPGNLSA